ncbi:tetratricopeptide repeat-containing sensor histidine kinase [Hymenobacter terricola]|uniref:tetratricopeptide repeat-containing sensor histidine kinase n=1 Tax=Hymenobacter terricola TaxID=2819236 RepID=UPI001B311ADC|nr:histidine kinase dimerization/phosphoacceptor domain -containing protein [Hymenobacter terricola]
MKFIVLILLVLSASASVKGEPMHPLLSQTAVDSLQTRLRSSQPDTNRVDLLLMLSRELIDRHEELKEPLANAYEYSKQAEQLSNKLHFTSGKIKSLYMLGQLVGTGSEANRLALIKEGIRLSKQEANKPLEALGYYYLGQTYSSEAENLPIKIVCYQKARQLYLKLGDKPNEAYLLKQIADMHLWQGQSAQALRELQQVLVLYRAAGSHRLHYTYDLMLAVNRQMGNYQEALHDGLAAIESAQATRDTVSIGGFYGRLARVYEELKQYDKALVYYGKAKRIQQQHGGNCDAFFPASHITRVLLTQKKTRQALTFFLAASSHTSVCDKPDAMHFEIGLRLGECYTALGSYELAEQNWTKMLAFVKTVDDADKNEGYYSISIFCLHTKQYSRARFYLNKALALTAKLGPLERMANVQLLLFKVDSAQAQFPAAITHYQRYKAIIDSVFSANKTRQIARLQIQYDTKKKEQNITLLTKQNQLQQVSLKQGKLLRNSLLGSAVLLSLLLGVSYSRYRVKQRSTALLEIQQREINQQNQALEQVLGEKDELLGEKDGLLEEKEWMLKEIHHRVKNNLQIISSLLSRQSHYLRDAPALAAIRESQNRVQAMALIHQKLYQSDSLARVNMQDYTREIVARLVNSFDCSPSIQQQVNVSGVDLEVALATPVGLIINEAVTNALKHAFPHQRTGTISVGLRRLVEEGYELTIEDDGVGLPAGFDVAASRSLGLSIIQGLSKQLHGTLSLTGGGGVRLNLRFAAIHLAAFQPASV